MITGIFEVIASFFSGIIEVIIVTVVDKIYKRKQK